METISRFALSFLLNSLWQITLIVTAAALCARMLRNAPARLRHLLWAVVLLACALLPLWSMQSHSTPLQLALVPSQGSARLTPQNASVVTTHSPRFSWRWLSMGYHPLVSGGPLAPGTPLAFAILGSFLVFLLYRIAQLGKAWKGTRRIRNSAQVYEARGLLLRVKHRCEVSLGVGNAPLLSSAHVPGPVTVGMIHPVIVAPENFFETSSERELAAALGHEMAHIVRKDFLLNCFCELIYVPVSFHPLAVFAKRRMNADRELACDQLVVERIMSATDYTDSLVNIARKIAHSPNSGYALRIYDTHCLEDRIMRIIKGRRLNIHLARTGFLGSILLLTIVCLASAAFSLGVEAAPSTNVTLIPSPAIPLQLSQVRIAPLPSGFRELKCQLVNLAGQRLLAAEVSWRIHFTDGPGPRTVSRVSYLFNDSELAPGAATTLRIGIPKPKRNPSLVDRITGEITFAEFADGKALGSDQRRAKAWFTDEWRSQVQAAQRLLLIYEIGGEKKLNGAINSESMSDTVAENGLKRVLRELEEKEGFPAVLATIKREASTPLPN